MKAVLLEFVRTLHQRSGIALPYDYLAVAFDTRNSATQGDAVVFLELGLVVEGIDVAHATAHEEMDHRLGPRLEVRGLGQIG